MSKEIERKFLVDREKLPLLKDPYLIRQGYIPTGGTATVRLRISNDKAYLTIKGRATGLTRSEFEYPVPVEDAQKMLEELCSKPLIAKKRYLIPYRGHTWELDIFEEENKGLIVAEIELQSEDEPFEKPPWLKEEVSFDTRYRNASLISYPYSQWENASS